MIQKTIWAEIAKLDTTVVMIALDELVRAATDGGIGSRRCEIMADTLIVLSSISVRGKILSKLRKVRFHSLCCLSASSISSRPLGRPRFAPREL